MDVTLVQMLERQAARLEGPFFEYLGTPNSSQSLKELWMGATCWAGRLREMGVTRADRVALAMGSRPEVLEAFFGALMCRAVVVPLPAPGPLGSQDRQGNRVAIALRLTKPKVLVAPRQSFPGVTPMLQGQHGIQTVELEQRGDYAREPELGRAEDLALVQLTSGSTGRPRGATLTHANLLANLQNVVGALGLTAEDRCVTWLPLHHDMGLIGTVLATVLGSTRTALLPPTTFIVHPARWLEALMHFGGTYATAPNFGYQMCVDRVPEAAIPAIDLSLWRRALNGAEPVRPRTLDAFARRFASCGFRADAFMPVYGLAESTLAVAFPPVGREPRVDLIDPARLRSSGRAEPVANGRAVVSVGRCFSDSELKIASTETGIWVPERHEGEIVVRGASVMTGYFEDTESTDATIRDGWLRTGDLGYLAEGELYITGRLKAVLVRAGEKFHAEDVEQAAEVVAGTRRGCSAAFAIDDPRGEEIVVVVEHRDDDHLVVDDLAKAVAWAVEVGEGLTPDHVYVVPPRSVPKTTSGKVERQKCRDLLLDGTLAHLAHYAVMEGPGHG